MQLKSNNWYVVKTNIRAEKTVNARLLKIGFETYLPLLQTMKIWSDRKKMVEQPLIPSTLFVYSTEETLKEIYKVQGVHTILKYLGKPAIVKENEIENLRILLTEEVQKDIKEIEFIEKGSPIEVIKGPFRGLIATAVEVDNKFRVVVQIESLETGFTVNVAKSCVKLI